jgi:hypothetical protein
VRGLVVLIALRAARLLVRIGLWFAKRGDKLGTTVVNLRRRINQRQEPAREHDQGDEDKTPDERHGKDMKP